MFTKVVLESSFHSKEWLKGQRVFEQNSVLNGLVDGSVLRGSVKSESHKSEQAIKDKTRDENFNARQQKAKPIVDDFING